MIQKLTSYRVGSSTPIKDAVGAGTIEKPIPIDEGRSAALELLLVHSLLKGFRANFLLLLNVRRNSIDLFEQFEGLLLALRLEVLVLN